MVQTHSPTLLLFIYLFFRWDAQCYRFSQGQSKQNQNIQLLQTTKSASPAEITVHAHNLQSPVAGCQPHNSFCTMICWILLYLHEHIEKSRTRRALLLCVCVAQPTKGIGLVGNKLLKDWDSGS